MHRQHTLRITTAFLLTTLACMHNAAHAALELVTIETKRQEVKEQPTIPLPPTLLQDAVSAHIEVKELQTIIYDYLRGSEIHEDHARFLHYAYEDIGLYKSPPELSPEFKFISRYIFTGKISKVDKKWIDGYLQADDHQGFLNIKNKCNTQNFFQYGFENFITIADHECIQVQKKHMLEYLLQSSESLTSPRDVRFNAQALCNMIKLLIENKAPVNAYLEERSKTPLRSAIDDFKNPELVQLMLAHKADPNYRFYRDVWYSNHYGPHSYLHRVDEDSKVHIVQSLLDAKADPHPSWQWYVNPAKSTNFCPVKKRRTTSPQNALTILQLKVSNAQEQTLTQDATEEDRKKAEKLALFLKMFEDAFAQQKQLTKDDA